MALPEFNRILSHWALKKEAFAMGRSAVAGDSAEFRLPTELEQRARVIESFLSGLVSATADTVTAIDAAGTVIDAAHGFGDVIVEEELVYPDAA